MPSRRSRTAVPLTWVVAYDIVDDARRLRVATVLEGAGRRVQYSVFECELTRPDAARIRQRVLREIQLLEDRIRWYPLCRPCGLLVFDHGGTRPSEDEEGFYLV